MIMKKHEFCFLYVKGQFVYIKPLWNAIKLIVNILWYFIHLHVLADAELLNKQEYLSNLYQLHIIQFWN